jgi:hypothetical protein
VLAGIFVTTYAAFLAFKDSDSVVHRARLMIAM